MSGQNYPFAPINGSTQTIAATTASQAVTFQTVEKSTQIAITNKGASDVFLRFGSGQTATTADHPCPVGITILSKGDHPACAVVCGSGTATVYITEGAGY